MQYNNNNNNMNNGFNSYNSNPSNGSNNDRPVNYHAAQRSAFFRKHGRKVALTSVIVTLALILLNECVFIVGESEQAMVSRFGVINRLIINNGNDFHTRYASQLKNEITTNGSVHIVEGSGLQFKMPFVDKVETRSSRLFTYISDSEVVNTAEKKQYYITTYAQWRICDPALFSLKLGSVNAAENQLDNIIHPVIVQAINRMIADDFISNKDALNSALDEGQRIINNDMCLRGIEVVDIQIHRTTLPSANIDSTYARMKADRAKVAQQLRSEGDESYNMAVASADLEARQIEATALSQAGTIRGEADAEAMEIYAAAYSADPEFYAFWRSLQALEAAVGENSVLVLDMNNPLFSGLIEHIQ